MSAGSCVFPACKCTNFEPNPWRGQQCRNCTHRHDGEPEPVQGPKRKAKTGSEKDAVRPFGAPGPPLRRVSNEGTLARSDSLKSASSGLGSPASATLHGGINSPRELRDPLGTPRDAAVSPIPPSPREAGVRSLSESSSAGPDISAVMATLASMARRVEEQSTSLANLERSLAATATQLDAATAAATSTTAELRSATAAAADAAAELAAATAAATLTATLNSAQASVAASEARSQASSSGAFPEIPRHGGRCDVCGSIGYGPSHAEDREAIRAAEEAAWEAREQRLLRALGESVARAVADKANKDDVTTVLAKLMDIEKIVTKQPTAPPSPIPTVSVENSNGKVDLRSQMEKGSDMKMEDLLRQSEQRVQASVREAVASATEDAAARMIAVLTGVERMCADVMDMIAGDKPEDLPSNVNFVVTSEFEPVRELTRPPSASTLSMSSIEPVLLASREARTSEGDGEKADMLASLPHLPKKAWPRRRGFSAPTQPSPGVTAGEETSSSGAEVASLGGGPSMDNIAKAAGVSAVQQPVSVSAPQSPVSRSPKIVAGTGAPLPPAVQHALPHTLAPPNAASYHLTQPLPSRSLHRRRGGSPSLSSGQSSGYSPRHSPGQSPERNRFASDGRGRLSSSDERGGRAVEALARGVRDLRGRRLSDDAGMSSEERGPVSSSDDRRAPLSDGRGHLSSSDERAFTLSDDRGRLSSDGGVDGYPMRYLDDVLLSPPTVDPPSPPTAQDDDLPCGPPGDRDDKDDVCSVRSEQEPRVESLDDDTPQMRRRSASVDEGRFYYGGSRTRRDREGVSASSYAPPVKHGRARSRTESEADRRGVVVRFAPDTIPSQEELEEEARATRANEPTAPVLRPSDSDGELSQQQRRGGVYIKHGDSESWKALMAGERGVLGSREKRGRRPSGASSLAVQTGFRDRTASQIAVERGKSVEREVLAERQERERLQRQAAQGEGRSTLAPSTSLHSLSSDESDSLDISPRQHAPEKSTKLGLGVVQGVATAFTSQPVITHTVGGSMYKSGSSSSVSTPSGAGVSPYLKRGNSGDSLVPTKQLDLGGSTASLHDFSGFRAAQERFARPERRLPDIPVLYNPLRRSSLGNPPPSSTFFDSNKSPSPRSVPPPILEENLGNFDSLILPEEGWRLENSCDGVSPVDAGARPLREPEGKWWYRDYFYGKSPTEFIGEDADGDTVSVSMVLDKSSENYRILIRSKEGIRAIEEPKPKSSIFGMRRGPRQLLLSLIPELAPCGKTFNMVDKKSIQGDLKRLEEQSVPSEYKFGVLLVKSGQINEDMMLGNQVGSQDWDDFLTCIGDRITLKTHTGYRGGLDVKDGRTGSHSVYARWHDLEIMYHVSSMLPMDPRDPQQLQRKRHIGNDVCLIVYLDGAEHYAPQTLTSHFTHVILCIKKEESASRLMGTTMYRISIASKNDVGEFNPVIPTPPLFPRGAAFRDFVISTLVSAERAAYSARGFRPGLDRTRKAQLDELKTHYYAPK